MMDEEQKIGIRLQLDALDIETRRQYLIILLNTMRIEDIKYCMFSGLSPKELADIAETFLEA